MCLDGPWASAGVAERKRVEDGSGRGPSRVGQSQGQGCWQIWSKIGMSS